MKSWFVLAAILFATPAFAEDEPTNFSELPSEQPDVTAQPPAEPPPTEEVPTVDPPPVKARMSTQPQSRSRTTVKDDGDGRLEKTEDTVAGGKHFRIKTKAGSVHVWVPPDYDRATGADSTTALADVAPRLSRQCRRSSALCHRSSRLFSRHFMMQSEKAGDTSGRSVVTGAGGLLR